MSNLAVVNFRANFDAAGKFFPDFPAARTKVQALSGKGNGCRKIGPAFGNAPGFSSPSSSELAIR